MCLEQVDGLLLGLDASACQQGRPALGLGSYEGFDIGSRESAEAARSEMLIEGGRSHDVVDCLSQAYYDQPGCGGRNEQAVPTGQHEFGQSAFTGRLNPGQLASFARAL